MHIDVSKILFIGTNIKKSSFFKEIQELGCVQFLKNENQDNTEIQELISLYSQAVKILKHYGESEESKGEVGHPYEFCQTVVSLENRKEELSASIKLLSIRLNELRPLGSIPFDDLLALSDSSSLVPRLWITPSSKHEEAISANLIFLTNDGPREYFISFNRDVPHIQGMREIIINEKVKKLGREYTEAKQELNSIEVELKRRAEWLYSLRSSFIDTMNTTKRTLVETQAQTPLDDHLFAIQGWVPETKKEEVGKIAHSLGILLEPIALDKEEVKPTYLENKGFARIGEDLVNIYDTPSYSDMDPSLWVLGFFSFFFAFIINDGGYGIIFLIVALYLMFRKKERPPSKSTNRFVRLIAILGITCITWGCAAQSFFGVEIKEDNPIHSLSIIHPLLKMHAQYHMDKESELWHTWVSSHEELTTPTLEEFLRSPSPSGKIFGEVFKGHLMFEIALLVGMIHILVGMGRYLFRHIAYAGWMVFLIGAYMYIPKMLGTTSILQHIFHSTQEAFTLHGQHLMIIGFSFAVICSLIRHGIIGLLEAFMTPVQMLGDVLSYLRLYALSLSGAIVAEMINQLGHSLPLIFAWVLIPICHTGNIILSTFGGVIHGLRLNFLEWYHYSFVGGGKPFSPLALEKIE
jgi:V/A-type H+-transporting ATPase subunit I